MLYDIQTIMWKEWRDLFMRGGRARSIFLTISVVIGIIGILFPFQIGRAWFDSQLVLALSAWIPIFLTASVVADSFAGERERHTLETLLASRLSDRAILLGKIAAAVSYGWIITFIVLLVQLVTINVIFGEGQFLFYQGIVGPGSVVISFLAACLAANIGVLISLRAPNTRQAQQTLNISTMLLFLVPTLVLQAMPDTWRTELSNIFSAGNIGTIIVGVIALLLLFNALFFAITLTQFRRTRLILTM